MKLHSEGDFLKAFNILDNTISKYSNTPAYFYVKSLLYLKDSYLSGEVSVKFISNTLLRYSRLIYTRNIFDEKVFESFVDISDEFGFEDITYQSLKNLLFTNPSNRAGIYFLVRNLFSKGKYEYIPRISKKYLDLVEIPEMSYYALLSKIYTYEYSDFDVILQDIVYNYDSDEVRFIVANTYYHTMDFDKAWEFLDTENRIIDQELQLKLMILRNESKNKISQFVKIHSKSISKDLIALAKAFTEDGEMLQKLVERKITSKEPTYIEPIYLYLGMRFFKNSEVYNKSVEKLAINFFSKKLYQKVIQLLSGKKGLSKESKYILALSHIEVGEYRKALPLLEELKNYFLEAEVKTASVYVEIGEFNRALREAKSIKQKVISRGSDLNKMVLSHVFLEIGDVSSSEEVYNSIEDKSSFYAKFLYATILFYKKEYALSEKVIQRLYDEDKYNPDLINSLAFIWAVQNKNLKEALILSKYSTVFDDNYYYFDTLAYIYLKLGEINLARESIEKAIMLMERNNRFSKDIYIRAYGIYKQLGEYDKSRLMLSKANRE
ncbi:MAG: hypothetical protein N3D81_02305 [Spirochaetes bacterium]|nr:hypothetical protein [Spirochaetota bacterium]